MMRGYAVQESPRGLAAVGRRYLALHGDKFDEVIRNARWLAFAGDWAYRTVLGLNTLFNKLRRRFGFGYWSFSAYLKVKVKNALQFIENFEAAVADEARRRGVGGVSCVNDGDWLESRASLVEPHNRRLEILEGAKFRPGSKVKRAAIETEAAFA